ncbi:MAG TPA: hypothetical protein PL009_00120 [Flavipsychrobacter sp.]|nr:hypothetical protein [Flavipsychrobacter sp.]
MKRSIFLLVILLLVYSQQALAQGVPQFIITHQGTPQLFDTTAASGLVSSCGNRMLQTSFDLNWFQPVLPKKGTITDIFVQIPKRRDTLMSVPIRFDTIIAGSPVVGVRIKMTLINYFDIYAADTSCTKVKSLTTVFNVPVFFVPTSLQGDDPSKCWLKFTLNTPFNYDTDAPLFEQDTSTYRSLVIDFNTDSNNSAHVYDPSNNTSYVVGRKYTFENSFFYKNRTISKQGSNACNLGLGCGTWGGNLIPVIGLNLAPNSIDDNPSIFQSVSIPIPSARMAGCTLNLHCKESPTSYTL